MIQIFETSGVKPFLFKFLVLDNGNKEQKLRKKKEQLEESQGGAYIFIKKKEVIFS